MSTSLCVEGPHILGSVHVLNRYLDPLGWVLLLLGPLVPAGKLYEELAGEIGGKIQ